MNILGWTSETCQLTDIGVHTCAPGLSVLSCSETVSDRRAIMHRQCSVADRLDCFLPAAPGCLAERGGAIDWTLRRQQDLRKQLSNLHGAVQITCHVSLARTPIAKRSKSWLRERASQYANGKVNLLNLEQKVRVGFASWRLRNYLSQCGLLTMTIHVLVDRPILDSAIQHLHGILSNAVKTDVGSFRIALTGPLPAFAFSRFKSAVQQ